jgi:hypothetical protein
MKGQIWTNIGRVLLILYALMQAGIFMALRTLTMVNPWIVIIVSAVISFPISILCARKATKMISLKSLPLRVATWMALWIPILTGNFYGINFMGADKEKAAVIQATVERKYHETRKRTRRVGRGRYVPTGETYQVYYADIRLADGHLVTVPLTGGKIPRVHKGQKLEVKETSGTLGIPVVITKDIFKTQYSR